MLIPLSFDEIIINFVRNQGSRSRYHWVLQPHQYKSKELLITDLSERVIALAQAKAKELARK